MVGAGSLIYVRWGNDASQAEGRVRQPMHDDETSATRLTPRGTPLGFTSRRQRRRRVL